MKPESKGETRCPEIIEEDVENAMLDYDSAEATASGKYRCRDCGLLFDTLEEHDKHHRKVHGRAETYVPRMPM